MSGGHWAQVCFTCQQVGEKALKAIALFRGADEIRSHSLMRIAEALAWIFGSYDSPSFGRDSDIDVFLVTDTTKPFVGRALDFGELRDLVPEMEILVYTPEEFRKLTGDPSPGFWRSAVASMRRMM